MGKRRTTRARWAGLGLLCLTACLSCGPLDEREDAELARGKGDGIATYFPSIARVESKGGRGSGVLIGPRVVLTAYHVCFELARDGLNRPQVVGTVGASSTPRLAGKRRVDGCARVTINGDAYGLASAPIAPEQAGHFLVDHDTQGQPIYGTIASHDLALLILDRAVPPQRAGGADPHPLPERRVVPGQAIQVLGYNGCSSELPCRFAAQVTNVDDLEAAPLGYGRQPGYERAVVQHTFAWPPRAGGTTTPGNSGGLVVAAASVDQAQRAAVAGIIHGRWSDGPTVVASQAVQVADHVSWIKQTLASYDLAAAAVTTPTDQVNDLAGQACAAGSPPNRCADCGWQFCYKQRWMPCAPAGPSHVERWCTASHGAGQWTCSVSMTCQSNTAECTPGEQRGCLASGAAADVSCGAQWCLSNGRWSAGCAYNWRRDADICHGSCDVATLSCR